MVVIEETLSQGDTDTLNTYRHTHAMAQSQSNIGWFRREATNMVHQNFLDLLA